MTGIAIVSVLGQEADQVGCRADRVEVGVLPGPVTQIGAQPDPLAQVRNRLLRSAMLRVKAAEIIGGDTTAIVIGKCRAQQVMAPPRGRLGRGGVALVGVPVAKMFREVEVRVVGDYPPERLRRLPYARLRPVLLGTG